MPSEQTRKRIENQNRILDQIRRWGSGGRSALSNELDIRKSSVTSICRELIDAGVLEELQPGAFRSQLGLHPAHWRSAVVSLRPRGAVSALVDCRGRITHRRRHPPVTSSSTPESQLEAVAAQVSETLSEVGTPVLGLGVSLPGISDPATGVAISSVNLPGAWKDIGVGSLLEETLGIGVVVENDASCQLLGNLWFSSREERQGPEESVIYLGIDEGIGCAMLSRGRLVRGSHFAVGEIGCLKAGDEGRSCACGKKDCLQTYCAVGPLLEGIVPMDGGSGGLHGNPEAEKAILALAEEGSPGRAELAVRLAPLTEKLATIVALTDPDVLVISTESATLTSLVREALAGQVKDSLRGLCAEEILLHTGLPCSDASLLGAGAAVFQKACARPGTFLSSS